MGGAVGVVLVAAANQCIDGVASAGNAARTLVAHSGDVKGDFAAFQGGQIHFFDGGAGRGGDEFLFDGKAFAAAVRGNAGQCAAAGEQEGGECECGQSDFHKCSFKNKG